MWRLLPASSALLLVLVASVAQARGPENRPVVRTILISEHPGEATNNLYVSGQVATVLRFEKDCDPARTKLLGWEGRFAPLLVGGRKVVLEPLRNLNYDERVPLLVTLADGTEVPFLVGPPPQGEGEYPDQQVNVFQNRESYAAIVSFLHDSRRNERELREENARLKKEEASVDHALATLLASGQVKKTPFRKERKAVLTHEGMDIMVEVFSGPGKAAVLVHLTNTYSEEPWKLSGARLTSDLTSYTARPFALRMDRTAIQHGESGRIAVVADKSAFKSEEGLVNLALEIFRADGLQQVVVNVDHTLIRK